MDSVRITSGCDSKADFILYQGNCLDLLSQIPNGFVNLVVTSPPYNLGKSYESRLEVDEYLSQQGRGYQGVRTSLRTIAEACAGRSATTSIREKSSLLT